MLAVSNTSPLRYLIAVDQAELLSQLFTEVLIPPGVAEELADPSAPAAVRQWIGRLPSWLQIGALISAPDAELSEALDRGEREAIQLAVERRADVLIMDEWKGREIVQRRGLPLTGALGVFGQRLPAEPDRRSDPDTGGDAKTRVSHQRRHGVQIPDSPRNPLPPRSVGRDPYSTR